MDALEALRARRSTREFSDTAIAKATIEEIIECARFAPTARGEEPWEFIAVTDKKRLAELAALTDHGKFIAGCACAIVVACKDTKYYLEDGCAATENILVASAALGIGSCWVAGDKKPYAPSVLAFCGMPEGYKLVSILALGHPAKAVKRADKRPLSSMLHWERF